MKQPIPPVPGVGVFTRGLLLAAAAALMGQSTMPSASPQRDPFPPVLATVRSEPNEDGVQASRRKADLNRLLTYPSLLEFEIKKILTDEALRNRDPRAIAEAARIAGTYRLAGCVPALSDLLLFPQGPVPWNLHDELLSPRQLEAMSPSDVPLPGSPAPAALVRIGKPSVPAMLRIASAPGSNAELLSRAGAVVSEIEGDAAVCVVEAYIKASADPPQTRKMLERQPFATALRSVIRTWPAVDRPGSTE